MRLPNQEIVNAIVLVIAGHQNGLADQRMERIGDHRFVRQKPGTMAPAQTSPPRSGCAASMRPNSGRSVRRSG